MLGWLKEACTAAAKPTGPMQSCGAKGRCQVSARAAILRPSVRPPVQHRSTIAVQRVALQHLLVGPARPSVSLAQTQTLVERAYSASACGEFMRIGSSYQVGA